MRRIAIYLLCIFMLLPVVTMTAQPGYNYSKLQREKLNRGVVAIRENPSEVIVSWRYLSSATNRFQRIQRREEIDRHSHHCQHPVP